MIVIETEEIKKMKRYTIGAGITSACNMNCPFCYSKNRRTTCAEVPVKLWIDFFNNNASVIKSINYGTPENTLCPDWYTLLKCIHDIDASIDQAITTNGTLFREIARDPAKEKIVRECISDVDVSLDYSNPMSHNEFRGHKNAYEMAIETLAYCQSSKKNTTIVIMGIEDNLSIENIAGIFEIAARYEALVRLNIYREVNRGSYLTPPSYQTLVRVFDWINEHHEICALDDPLFAACFTQNTRYEDSSGKCSLRILPDGGIYPSTYLIAPSYCIGNIASTKYLDELATHPLLNAIVDVIPEDCRDCPVVDSCKGGALDRRMLRFGEAGKRDPYCPYNHGDLPGSRSYETFSRNFSSVHDGYLPTLFFRPKVK